jgi:multiple sugar transport system permease protein
LELGLVDKGVEWLFNPIAGQWAIILAFAWRSTPFLMVIILAALQSVPEEVLDAAEVDGANYFQKTYRVTLPFIRNIILSAALLQTVRLFQEMSLPFVLTQGGPMNSTMVLSMFSYKLAFEAWDFALAATVGVVWLIMLLTFGSIYLKGLVREH